MTLCFMYEIIPKGNTKILNSDLYIISSHKNRTIISGDMSIIRKCANKMKK